MAVAATTRFSGRAFWVALGATSDRGRMDVAFVEAVDEEHDGSLFLIAASLKCSLDSRKMKKG